LKIVLSNGREESTAVAHGETNPHVNILMVKKLKSDKT
jgi:hypothetical protein